MSIFHLPDLGEGLLDAEIHEWYVKVGDHIEQDQPLVAMETAKALVDIPSPQTGTIVGLFGKAGDVIKTGAPLIQFKSDSDTPTPTASNTVVGQLETLTAAQTPVDQFTIGTSTHTLYPRATPAVKALAKQLKVNLTMIQGTGAHGLITRADVERAVQHPRTPNPSPQGGEGSRLDEDGERIGNTAAHSIALHGERLHGVRRNMCQVMTLSHHQVVPATLFDEVDIQSWPQKPDLTVRLIRAMIAACQQEPALNAWFDGEAIARQCFPEAVHIGIAVDSEAGLFVPVLHHAEQKTDLTLRETLDQFKQQIQTRSLKPEQFQGATIVLSNFGKFAGRFATPVITPPTVAILGVGRVYAQRLPLSLSFDHRAVTGGEAARFLSVLIQVLQQSA